MFLFVFVVLEIICACIGLWSRSCLVLTDARIVDADDDGLLLTSCRLKFAFEVDGRNCTGSRIFGVVCPAMNNDAVISVCYNPENDLCHTYTGWQGYVKNPCFV